MTTSPGFWWSAYLITLKHEMRNDSQIVYYELLNKDVINLFLSVGRFVKPAHLPP